MVPTVTTPAPAGLDIAVAQLPLPLTMPAQPPDRSRPEDVIEVDHAGHLHARWAVTLRERFYARHLPDVAEERRFVIVAVPVPAGWRVAFGQERIRAYGCTGELLNGHVAEGTVLVEFTLALLRESLDRYFAARPQPTHRATRRAM